MALVDKRVFLILKKLGTNFSSYQLRTRLLNTRYNHNLQLGGDLKEVYENIKYKILYNSHVETLKFNAKYNKEKPLIYDASDNLPVALKYYLKNEQLEENDPQENFELRFPYATSTEIEGNDVEDLNQSNNKGLNDDNLNRKEVNARSELFRNLDENWMRDYEKYDETDMNDTNELIKSTYGTPDPTCKASNVACSGCGSILHCKDQSIPGYLPSEIYKNHLKTRDLNDVICQRCHFLKHYNIALQVRVSANDYNRVLENISGKKALLILLVDLLDFPCSLWPDIAKFVGKNTSVFVVGNKIDLFPIRRASYLTYIRRVLIDSTKNIPNVAHTCLISAKTGYGIEELINKLHVKWGTKGNVYLLGCTNAGKSTLFNHLLQSDLCKIQAANVIHRATVSPWPGTTINLLKFPILRPSGWRLYVRTKRLQSLNKIKALEQKTKKENDKNQFIDLISPVEATFSSEEPIEAKDPFNAFARSRKTNKTGIDEKDPAYALSKWCFDTPGVIQPDQIFHLLTVDELVLTIPKFKIMPQTYILKNGTTLFIGGLGRFDYLSGGPFIRATVFCSPHLPITICKTQDAEEIYSQLIGTDFFQVPRGTPSRLSKWPQLKSGEKITLKFYDWHTCPHDVVLSNAGWISLSTGPGIEVECIAWTPEARGIHIRNSFLPDAVQLKGRKIRGSPEYVKIKTVN